MSRDKSNMRVPEDYFNKRKNDFLHFANGDEDMLDMSKDAPVLASLGKRDGFLLPEDYFVNLDLRKDKPIVKQIRPQNWIIYATAACVLCLFGYFGLTQIEDTTAPSEFLVELESEEDIEKAYEFLIRELDGFTNEELMYEDVFADFLLEEENITDTNLETIINELSDEFQIEDFEDIF